MKRLCRFFLILAASLAFTLGLAACGMSQGGSQGGTEQGGTEQGGTEQGGNQSGSQGTQQGGEQGGNQSGTEQDGHEHSFTVENVCSICGKRWVYMTVGLVYTLNEDQNTYSVAWNGKTKLIGVVIPYGHDGKFVTSIGERAFYNCSSLENIEIPESVTSIGTGAFGGTAYYNDQSHWDASGVLYIGKHLIKAKDTVSGSYIIRKGTKMIADEAFMGCSSLIDIEIPDSVIAIGMGALRGCCSFESIKVARGNLVYHSAGNCLIETESKTLIAGCKTSVIPGDGSVTSIGNYAFDGCSSLESIEIPAEVSSIGESAFFRCGSLTSVMFESESKLSFIGNSAFRACSLLESIDIPAGVTMIGESAFRACSLLASVEIPDSVTSIAPLAMYGTAYYNERSHWDASGVLYIGNHLIEAKEAISGAYLVRAGTKTVADQAFEDCSSLTSIKIPASVRSIGDHAFRYCSSLAGIEVEPENRVYRSEQNCLIETETETLILGCKDSVIPSDVTSIGDYAFYGCYFSTDIEIPASVISIGGYAFYNCHSSAAGLEIPASVMSIGDYAFYNCDWIAYIKIPATVTSIGVKVFYGCSSLASIEVDSGNGVYRSEQNCLIEIATQTLISGCKNSVIPDGVTSIGSDAFGGCDIESVKIPESVTSIGSCAFKDCSRLISVTFEGESQLTSIGDSAFYACRLLKRIEIPERVTSIGSDAVMECSALESVAWNAENCANVESYIFSSRTKLSTVIFGERVKNIPLDVFQNCSYIESFLVDGRNGIYSSQDGILYNKAQTGLILVPKAIRGAVTIPEGVTSIGNVFSECSTIESIKLPASLTLIEQDAFLNCSSLESVTFEGESRLTSIGSSAFGGCSSLESIEIPAGVTSIRDDAFKYCSALGNVTFEGESKLASIGWSVFEGCSSLESIKIPASVTSIGDEAFYRCRSLASIEIPASVTSIGYHAFLGCSSLESIEVDAGNKVYRSEQDCLIETESGTLILGCKNSVIPEGVTSIGEFAFFGCSSLTSIKIPASVTSIGYGAFSQCSGSLESIEVDAGNKVYRSEQNCLIKMHPDTLILGCKNSVIPSSVIAIAGDAFNGCSLLESIKIPSSVIAIAGGAFNGCGSLEKIEVEAGNQVFRSEQNCLIENRTNTLFLGCKNSVIPDSVTSIGWYAFFGCSSLESIKIPASVTSIGEEAFCGCSSLKSIEIPASVTSIGYNAFEDCSSLTSIEFKGTVSEWRAIEKESGWNSSTGNYIVTCTDGKIDINGNVTMNSPAAVSAQAWEEETPLIPPRPSTT